VRERELLIVIVPAQRRAEVVDLFMATQALDGFTRTQAAGFSREHSHFSLTEAVQGFADQERFEIIGTPEVIDELLAALGKIAGRDRFFFWTMPVSRQGRLG
jgi:hypothetical protein